MPTTLILDGTGGETQLFQNQERDVVGTSAAETLTLNQGSSASFLAGSGDAVNLSGSIDDYDITASGNTITLTNSSSGNSAEIALNAETDIRFQDGGTSAQVDSSDPDGDGSFDVVMGQNDTVVGSQPVDTSAIQLDSGDQSPAIAPGDGNGGGTDQALTVNADSISPQGGGTSSGDDVLDGSVEPVEGGGPLTNTLNTGDEIDGGAGTDRIEAELVSDNSLVGVVPIRPETNSVEEVELNALLQRGVVGFEPGKGEARIGLNAEAMDGVEEWSSSYSQNDLTLQNLTTEGNTEDVTIRMDHTGNDDGEFSESDLKALFDQNHLLSGEDPGTETIQLRVMNQDAFDAGLTGNPLTSVVFQQVSIEVGGDTFDLTDVNGQNLLGESNDTTGEQITDYQDLVDALNGAFDTLRSQNPNNDALQDLEASLNGSFDDPNGRTGTRVDISADTGVGLGFATSNPNNSVFLQPSEENADITGFGEIENSNRFDNANPGEETPDQDLPVTASIELEKAGRGGDGGDLTVGGMSDNPADQGIEVFNVTVQGGEDLPSNLASMSAKKAGALNEINIATADGAPENPASLTVGNPNTDAVAVPGSSVTPVPSGLDLINANEFEGNLTLGTPGARVINLSELDAGDMGGNLTLWGQLSGQGDYQGPNTFFDADGTGTFSMENGAVFADFASADSLESGSNSDIILVRDASTGDPRVTTDGGNDTVALNGGTGDGGSAAIDGGSGNDAIFTEGHALNGTSPQKEFSLGTQPVDNKFFGGQLKLTLNGVESEWVDISSEDFETTSADVNAALGDAIESRTELDSVLSQSGSTITVQADGDTYDLSVDTRGPVAADLDANEGLNSLGNLSGADIDPSVNRISESDLSDAWSTYFTGSTFEDTDGSGSIDGDEASDSDEGAFGNPTSFNEFLSAMQGHVPDVSVLPVQDGGGNDRFTNVSTDAGSGDDVITLSTNASDTIDLNGNFDRTTVLNAQNNGQQNHVDFTSYLDSEAAERGSSVNDGLESGDAHTEGFVPFQFQADSFNESGLSGANDDPATANPTVDQLVTANLNDASDVEGVHNNIKMLSFESLFGELDGNQDTDDPTDFAGLGTSELNSIFEDDGTVDAPDGPGSADDPTSNEFALVVGRDAEQQYQVNSDGEIVGDGVSSLDQATEFKVFEGSVSSAEADGEFNIEVDNLAGTLDLTNEVGGGKGPLPPPNLDPTVTDVDTSVAEDAAAGTTVAQVDASDPDGTVDSFSFTGGNADTDGDGNTAFEIDNSGNITVGDTDDLVEGSATDPFSLDVQVTDDDGDTATGTANIDVTDSGGGGSGNFDSTTTVSDGDTLTASDQEDESFEFNPSGNQTVEISSFGDGDQLNFGTGFGEQDVSIQNNDAGDDAMTVAVGGATVNLTDIPEADNVPITGTASFENTFSSNDALAFA